MGSEIKIKSDDQRIRPNKSEVERLFCDNTKLKTLTDWTPDFTLKAGLIETINWISRNTHLFKSNLYNV